MNNFFDNLIDIRKEKNICLTGMTDEFFCVYLSKLFKEEKRNILLVTSTLYEANKLMNSLNNYTNKSLLFPMDDFLTSEVLAVSPDLRINRLETLNKIMLNTDVTHIIITNLMGYLRFLPVHQNYVNSFINLQVGDTVSPKDLVDKFIKNGYTRDTIVNKTGEFVIPVKYELANDFKNGVASVKIKDGNYIYINLKPNELIMKKTLLQQIFNVLFYIAFALTIPFLQILHHHW